MQLPVPVSGYKAKKEENVYKVIGREDIPSGAEMVVIGKAKVLDRNNNQMFGDHTGWSIVKKERDDLFVLYPFGFA